MLKGKWTWRCLLAWLESMQQGMWTPMCRHACDRKHAGRHTCDRVAHSYWLVSSICTQLPWSFSFIQKYLKTWVRERNKSRKRKQEIPSCYENFREFLRTEILPGSSEDCPEVKEGSFRVLISPDQSIQDIDVGFWDLTSRYQDEDLEGRKRVWSTSGIKESSHIA